MGTQQARLIAAIKDAQEAQGIMAKEMATAAGTTASNWSQAMGGKVNLSREKWKMACEKVGLDYDEVVANYELPPEDKAVVEDETDVVRFDNVILAAYVKKRLEEDIRRGIEDMSMDSLYHLIAAAQRYTT